jgi:gas vesicle protein
MGAIILAIMGIVGAFSAIAGAASSHKEAQRQKSEAETQAAVAELQAEKYELQQETVLTNIESVEEMKDQLERQKNQVLEDVGEAGERATGEQSLLFGASGLTLTGTPLDIMRETTRNIEKDIAQVTENYRSRRTVLSNKIETMESTYEQLGLAAEAARTQGQYYEETAMSIDPTFEAFSTWFSGMGDTALSVLTGGVELDYWGGGD